MATFNTIKKLGKQFPASVEANIDVKLEMAETDAIHLLNSGFIDCSYSNDECAIYYFDKEWGSEGAPTIAAVLITGRVVYEVYTGMELLLGSFSTNLDDAIIPYRYKPHLSR